MRIVFTNGVFDLLHVGHLRLLHYARSFGDHLVVGINSDSSARRLKGLSRPILPQDERRELLLSLKCVDQVEIFEEDTPARLITDIKPQVLVKGPGSQRPLSGETCVLSSGGEVIVPDWPIDQSTTNIVHRIRHGDAFYPWPDSMALYINGDRVPFSAHYSMRFVDGPDGPRPVLYGNGRRVTAPWKIELVHAQPGDQYGVSG